VVAEVDTFFRKLVLVEGLQRVEIVGEDLDRPLVNLAQRLDLDVVPSRTVQPCLNISINVFFSAFDKILEKLLLALDVLHAEHPQLLVKRLIPVDLVRDTSEQAVAVLFAVPDDQILRRELFCEPRLQRLLALFLL